MSPFEILKQDHSAVSSLLDKLDVLPDDERPLREDTFHQLHAHLELHSYLEENFFYPHLRRKPEMSELADRLSDEHAKLKRLLSEMSQIPKSGAQFKSLLGELRREIEEHVTEEEKVIFARAREVLSLDEWDDIGRRMQLEKSQQLAEK